MAWSAQARAASAIARKRKAGFARTNQRVKMSHLRVAIRGEKSNVALLKQMGEGRKAAGLKRTIKSMEHKLKKLKKSVARSRKRK